MAKKYVRAFVSDEAYEGWYRYSGRHGVSITALVESFGQVMAEGLTEEPCEHVAQVIVRAREIDADRRRRI